ncbi:hypothetical protein NTCA1_43020 [Novosphingobium sp. TCA1]|nr:hypothetical protein NTCA1_43020 [Novosphingobium sp. TCA1]
MIAGDFNVMPTDLDVYPPNRWRDDALFASEVRAAYARLLEQGWTDALRERQPGVHIYTFWKYWKNSFERDAGLRIDHVFLNEKAAACLVGVDVDRRPRGWDKTSDHAAVWIELMQRSKGQRKA